MHARLAPQVPERAVARHLDERLLVRVARAHALDADRLDDARGPPSARREALVHAQELGREQGRLGAADARLELDEGREGRGGRGRREDRDEVLAHAREGGGRVGDVGEGELAHVGVRLELGELVEARYELRAVREEESVRVLEN